MSSARIRFRAFVKRTGGNAAVARLLAVHPSYVSLLVTGRRVPSLAVATTIETMTQAIEGGPIKATSWARARSAATTPSTATEPRAAA